MLEHGLVYNLDPVILHLGPLQLRYYGIIFATMLYIGFVLWRSQMLRGGYSLEIAEKFLVWGVIAVIAGSRLGHCFFYEPGRFLRNPITILYFWKGGLASHGALLGLVLALFFFSRKYKLPLIDILDRFSMSSAVGAASVRLGNFFNSEIVGRKTDLPWAVRFVRYEDGGDFARHPVQLYEMGLALVTLLALFAADRFAGREQRRRGLLSGLFLLIYFGGRFFVEYAKEYETLDPSSPLTLGQYLSIAPALCGVGLLIWGNRGAKRTDNAESAAEEPSLKKKRAKK